MAKTTKAEPIIKRKKWMPIIAPKVFNEQPIGETYISEAEEAIGKDVTVSLMTLTGDPQKQTTVLSFTMTGINNNVIMTKPIGYSIVPSAVRKTMRKGKEKVEDSFMLTTQDNVKVLIKPIFVTKGKVKGSVLANLRRTARAQLTKIITTMTFENILLDLVMHKLQRALGDMLRKIYPLSTCEIKQFSIVKKIKEVTETQKEPVQINTAPAEPAIVS